SARWRSDDDLLRARTHADRRVADRAQEHPGGIRCGASRRRRNVRHAIAVSLSMRKIAPLLLTLLFAPFLFASEADTAVMKTVFLFTAHTNHSHGVAPAVVREKTLGGADSFATEWIKKTAGDVIGGELAASYEKVNAEEEDVNDFFPKLVKTV